MKLISKDNFLNWLKEHDIRVTINTSSNIYSLSLSKNRVFSKSWQLPVSSGMPHFLLQILNNVDKWEKCFFWKINGEWEYDIRDRNRTLENVWANMLHKLGMPNGFKGAIEYKRSELWDLLSFLQVQCTFMWCGADEFFVVFDNLKQIIFVDEDHNLHLEFLDQKRLDKFVSDFTKEEDKGSGLNIF